MFLPCSHQPIAHFIFTHGFACKVRKVGVGSFILFNLTLANLYLTFFELILLYFALL